MNKIQLVAIFTAVILVAGVGVPLDILADVLPPLKQSKFGIASESIICKQGLVPAKQNSDGQIICVKPKTAERMNERGLITILASSEVISSAEKHRNSKPVGNINILAITEQELKPGIFKSQPGVDFYNVIFEICASNKNIRTPEVIVRSDSETRHVKLAERIFSNTCQSNVVKIKATSSDSIKLELLNKGGVSEQITKLEEKVNNLTTQLEEEKSKLSTRIEQKESTSPERMAKIVELRTDLNKAREELNRYLFALNVMPKLKSQDIEVPKTHSGEPIVGITVNKLSAMPSLNQKDTFDVAFEICAASQQLRVPNVVVKSDLDSKAVKMADKIIANSCQISGVKIKSSDADSITVSAGDTDKKSGIVSNLEKQVTDLTKSLQAKKQELRDLTHFAPRPADFNEQVSELANAIVDLREQILNTKAKLHQYLNQAYK